MHNLPVLTVLSIITALVTTGYGVCYLLFGDFTESGRSVPLPLEIIVYGLGGGVAMWVLGWLIFIVLPYLWGELCVIPRTIRQCLSCRG
jgi:hypothetical protein